jgi:hypothetical protein
MFLTPSNNLLSGYRQDADHIDTVCDSSVLPFTIVLPDLLLAEDKEYIFCNIGANAVTIKPIGGQLFSDGSSTYTLDAYQAATFVSDLKKCWIMSSGNADLLYQPLDADLTAIAALTGTSGLLKKTAANTWALDTSTYLTANQSITLSGDVTGSGTTAISTVAKWGGLTSPGNGTSGYVLMMGGMSGQVGWYNIASHYAPLTHGCSAGYFPYATSTTAWGNSPMYYNGTNIGIGTTSPSYLLTMEASGGGYYSASDHQWHNGSSRSIKKNIALNKINVLKILDELKIVQYNYKTEINTDMKHVGFIAEDTHPLLSGKDQNGQSVADCIGFLLAVVKIQQRQIKKLSKQRVLA